VSPDYAVAGMVIELLQGEALEAHLVGLRCLYAVLVQGSGAGPCTGAATRSDDGRCAELNSVCNTNAVCYHILGVPASIQLVRQVAAGNNQRPAVYPYCSHGIDSPACSPPSSILRSLLAVGSSTNVLHKLATSRHARDSVEGLARGLHPLEALGLEGLLPRLHALLGRMTAGGVVRRRLLCAAECCCARLER
jgi:hypothetical protein